VAVCIFGIAILVKAFSIGVINREYWLTKKDKATIKVQPIEASRGNVYSTDGSFLATSIPIFDIRVDFRALNSDQISKEKKKIIIKEIDSLAVCLSQLFPEKSKEQYKHELKKEYQSRSAYYLLKKDVRFNELKRLKQFPIFRRGRYKGGLVVEQKSRREMPFKKLAARTLGRYVSGTKPIGIEGAYNNYLSGIVGKRLMQKISGGVWKPVNDKFEVEPKEGQDVVSTIDVRLQDVAENTLMRQLQVHNAKSGCVILMEVETGYVRAIANLGKTVDSSYYENFNYAIGSSTEPGSTFKLASLMALFEDELAKPSDIWDTHGGKVRFGSSIMSDSHEGGYGKITLHDAFVLSSNTAISQAIYKAYISNPQKFIDRIKRFHLHQPLGIELSGEGKPKINDPNSKTWSGISLPWMSIGYESNLTPLQILNFYNTVANNGKMMKPQFVEEIRNHGQVIEHFNPIVIDSAICSHATINKLKPMLEGVVERGTAKNLKNQHYKIAGKTGTAQIAQGAGGYGLTAKTYQASFVGYFPADKPKYSCIVVVSDPSNGIYYANLVAGPIFKEVADKVYAHSIEIQDKVGKPSLIVEVPKIKNGKTKDFSLVFNKMGVKTIETEESDWVKTEITGKSVRMDDAGNLISFIPNVTGMGLRDAIFLLENSGLRVKVLGKGTVLKQSQAPGTKIIKNSLITIQLG
jgi:cell division protein FtsI (penicillin-binding protein 3)